MTTTSIYAAAPEPPARSVTVFFAMGLPTHVQDDHLQDLSGPLEPLEPHRQKLGFVRGLRFPGTDRSHVDGGMGPFTGALHVSRAQAGGPSIDQVMLQELYPTGSPGIIPTVGMGVSGAYRINDLTRPNHFHRVKSWRNDGSPSVEAKDMPRELFDRIFGSAPGLGETETEQRLRRSLLDSVIEQYRHFVSDASNLGQASRSRIRDHLERIREYERRAFQGDAVLPNVCTGEGPPSNPDLYRGQHNVQGIDIQVTDMQRVWRLNADLFTMALRCDLTRFGWASFLAPGERIDFRGDYHYDGRLIYNFNDTRDQLGADPGIDPGVSHEQFHRWDRRDGAGARVARHHLHFHLSEVAYLLSRLDDPDHLDENGGTLFDNAMVMITTELSEPGVHNVTNVLHLVGSANERFRTGGTIVRAGNGERPVADLYNTVLRAYGVDRTMAPRYFRSTIDELKA